MKSFKEYLIESKQVYEFKVKIAGDLPDGCAKRIKEALTKFKVENCSAGKSTPIQETQIDFPTHKNVSVTVFDVTTEYPATGLEIRDMVAEHCDIALSCIKVRNLKEEEELELNNANSEPTGEALLAKEELEEVDGQKLVGDKHTLSLLKDLTKNKKSLEQYKGVNDKILAKKVPSEKTVKAEKVPATKSPISGKGK
jgi:copper chaperone CopZ